jgi:DNA-binding NarL/FixJ family response regulator
MDIHKNKMKSLTTNLCVNNISMKFVGRIDGFLQKKILIADNDSVTRGMLTRFLQPGADRFEILSASDEYQTLNQLRLKDINLLIIDPQISHHDEYSFLTLIRNEHPDLSIFVVTSFGTPEIQKKIEGIGRCRFFEKPLEMDVITQTILQEISSPSLEGRITGVNFPSQQNPLEDETKPDREPEPVKPANNSIPIRTTGKLAKSTQKSAQTNGPKYSEHYSLTEQLIAQIEKLQMPGMVVNQEDPDSTLITDSLKQPIKPADPVLNLLKTNPNIITFGIYDRHDNLHATPSESDLPEHFKPSVYRNPSLSLINQINGGPFKFLMIKNTDIHYLIFWYRKKWILLLVNPDFQTTLLFEKLLNGIPASENNNNTQNYSTGLILRDEKMEKLLEKLNQTQGIMGSYALSIKKGVIANQMPPVFTSTKLLTIGKLLIKIYLAGKMSIKKMSEISLFYQESVITIREIADQTYVVVLFDPSMRMNHLSTSLNMIMSDLKQLAGQYAPTDLPRIKNSIPQEPEHKPKSKLEIEHILEDAVEENESVIIDPDTLISSGPMAGVLQEMQTALTKVIGPIAPILFTVSLKEWIATDHPDFSTIQGLVDILRKEINDSEKFDTYHKKITPYIWVNN